MTTLPGYDAWKLTNPYEMTRAQEREMEERHADQIDRLREAIACALSDERGSLYRADVRRVVIEELNKVPRLAGEPEWQARTPVPLPPLG